MAKNFTKKTIQQIVNKLYEHNIQSVIIEGGANSLQHFINANYWDEARVFVGRKEFREGVKSPIIKGFIENRYSKTKVATNKSDYNYFDIISKKE